MRDPPLLGLPTREIGVMVLGTLIALVRFGALASGASTVDGAWSAVGRLIGHTRP